MRALVLNEAVAKVVSLNQIRQIMVNNKSTFFKGGFSNDTGLSGRKIICDTYCGLAPHGGGSFSWKDPSKIDRSGAYMARFVAKNIVANGLSRYCLLSVAYAFGEDKPIMLSVETGEKKRDQSIRKIVLEKFDFRPSCIIERLNLKRIKFYKRKTGVRSHQEILLRERKEKKEEESRKTMFRLRKRILFQIIKHRQTIDLTDQT